MKRKKVTASELPEFDPAKDLDSDEAGFTRRYAPALSRGSTRYRVLALPSA